MGRQGPRRYDDNRYVAAITIIIALSKYPGELVLPLLDFALFKLSLALPMGYQLCGLMSLILWIAVNQLCGHLCGQSLFSALVDVARGESCRPAHLSLPKPPPLSQPGPV